MAYFLFKSNICLIDGITFEFGRKNTKQATKVMKKAQVNRNKLKAPTTASGTHMHFWNRNFDATKKYQNTS